MFNHIDMRVILHDVAASGDPPQMSMYTDELLQALERWNGILSAPSKEALKTPRGIRVFKNSFLEHVIARAHPIVPGLWVFPVVAYLIQRGFQYQSTGMNWALVFLGFCSWTLLEYAIHMVVFHLKVTPQTPKFMKNTLFMLHGYHHEYPSDPTRLVMPIALAWPLGTILGSLFWVMLGSSYFFGFYAGVLLGYLGYDWMHYYSHHIRPSTRIGKYLHEFHAIHHFVDENKNFGISSPLWDWIFGKAKAPRAQTKTA